MIEPVRNTNIQVPEEPEAAVPVPVQEEVVQEANMPPTPVIRPPFWYGFVCDPKTGKCTCQAIPIED